MTRILIVANQTAAGQHLIDAVLKRRAEGECEFTLLVPHIQPSGHGGDGRRMTATIVC